MALSGKQKAAMLLTSLDPGTVVELLRGLPAENLQEIGIELTRMDAMGNKGTVERVKVAQEFFASLKKTQKQGLGVNGFFGEMLMNVLGKDKAEQIQAEIRKVTEKSDVFDPIRAASADALVPALEGQHQQTIAVILSELESKKSQEVLLRLSDESRLKAVCRMTNMECLRPEVKQKIAGMICERLKSVKVEVRQESGGQGSGTKEHPLRKLAVMLTGLEKDLRDRMLAEINQQNSETCDTIKDLMVTWEDILVIADRSIQEAMRGIDVRKLAIGLNKADPEIAKKIRSNISEKTATTLDEETSLMQEPEQKDILEARAAILVPLKTANEEGKLKFIQR